MMKYLKFSLLLFVLVWSCNFQSAFANFFDASIQIEKWVNGADNDIAPGVEIYIGDTVTFTYEVTNTGTYSFDSVTVWDDNGTPADTTDDFNPNYTSGNSGDLSLLEPGERWYYEAIEIALPGLNGNEGTVIGEIDDLGGVIQREDSDPAYYTGVPIPEPTPMMLMGMGLLFIASIRRRQK